MLPPPREPLLCEPLPKLELLREGDELMLREGALLREGEVLMLREGETLREVLPMLCEGLVLREGVRSMLRCVAPLSVR